MPMATARVMTIGDVAKLYGIPAWKVRRVYEVGILPPADRLGPNRIVHAEQLPALERALRGLRYLPAE
jgi:hypothetical protein